MASTDKSAFALGTPTSASSVRDSESHNKEEIMEPEAPGFFHRGPFVEFMRKIYRPLGFKKGYNFPLFIIFNGALFGFVLARFSFLDIDGDGKHSYKMNASPGEWFHQHKGHARVGITLHLATCLPAGFLAVWQFVPIIRHKFILFHRINGYIILLLCLCANAGALMIANVAFGGGVEVQVAVGVLAIMTTGSLCLAYYNIKMLQIDQHRAWMLRAWFYFGTIISMRLMLLTSAAILTRYGDFYQLQSCAEISFIFGGDWATMKNLPPFYAEIYPACVNATGTTLVPVVANHAALPEQIGAAFGLSFGMCAWLAITLHAIGVETYLWLTPAEGARLRKVSYERQLEAGFKNPGNAGLTVQKLGDAAPFKFNVRTSASSSTLEK